MGWIERMQNPRSGNVQDMLARRVAKGLGFSLTRLSQVEANLGIRLPEEASFTEHMETLLRFASHGDLCSDNPKWGFRWFTSEIGPKTIGENKGKWFEWAKGMKGVIVLGKKAGCNDCVAIVTVPEDGVHESLRLPRCTLVDRDHGYMVFVKEAADFIHDLATVERWID